MHQIFSPIQRVTSVNKNPKEGNNVNSIPIGRRRMGTRREKETIGSIN